MWPNYETVYWRHVSVSIRFNLNSVGVQLRTRIIVFDICSVCFLPVINLPNYCLHQTWPIDTFFLDSLYHNPVYAVGRRRYIKDRMPEAPVTPKPLSFNNLLNPLIFV